MPFTILNDALIHYADEGPRDAPALAMLNSLGTDLRIWDAVAALLTPRFRVIRADKRGHGLSTLPAGSEGMGVFARDTAALMDRLGVKRATIVGLSIGGLIAQELHRQRPDLVAALVLCDTAVKVGNEQSWDGRIAMVESGGIASFADKVMQVWFSAAFHAAQPETVAGYRTMLVRQPVDGYIMACRALRAADLRPHAGQIRVPTLCMVGEEDGSTPPPMVRETAGLIAHARFELIKGAGHIPNVEQPELVTSLIEAHARLALA